MTPPLPRSPGRARCNWRCLWRRSCSATRSPVRATAYLKPASGLARPPLAPFRLALEKQRLAQNRRDCGWLEGLRDQESRLRPLAGEKALRISRDEDDRDLEGPQHLVDRIETGRAVGQLNVGEDDARPLGLRQRHRLLMSTSDTENAMAQAFHQTLEVERDEGFVLDDQYIGGNLLGEFATCILDQLAQCRDVDAQYPGSIVFREPFERHQQERLAGPRCNLGQMPFHCRAGPGTGGGDLLVEADRIPDLREQLIERDPGRGSSLENARILDQ